MQLAQVWLAAQAQEGRAHISLSRTCPPSQMGFVTHGVLFTVSATKLHHLSKYA